MVFFFFLNGFLLIILIKYLAFSCTEFCGTKWAKSKRKDRNKTKTKKKMSKFGE